MSDTDAPVSQMLAAYKAAVHAKDVDAYCALFADDLHAFDMWGRWSHEGLPAWRATASDWFGSLGEDRVAVDFDEVHASTSGDMASAHAYVKFSAVSPAGATLRSMDNRLTWVLRRRDGAWKVVHQHTSAPLANANAQPMFQR